MRHRPSLDIPRQSVKAFLAGFLPVAVVVVVVGVFLADIPDQISDSARLEESRKGAARGHFVAEQDARDYVAILDPRRIEEEIEALLRSGEPEDG